MKKLEIPGLIALIVVTVGTTLINYFSVGGAGYEWGYASIAVIVLGSIVKIVEVNTVKPEPTNPTQPSAQARGLGDVATPAQPSKVQRFLLG